MFKVPVALYVTTVHPPAGAGQHPVQLLRSEPPRDPPPPRLPRRRDPHADHRPAAQQGDLRPDGVPAPAQRAPDLLPLDLAGGDRDRQRAQREPRRGPDQGPAQRRSGADDRATPRGLSPPRPSRLFAARLVPGQSALLWSRRGMLAGHPPPTPRGPTRESGGIGRRAGFRFLSRKG